MNSEDIKINLTYTIKEELDPPVFLGNIITDLHLDKIISLKNLQENTLTFFPWSQVSSKYFMIYKESGISQKLFLQKRINREHLCFFQHRITRSKIFSTCICYMEIEKQKCFMLISLSFMEYLPEMLVITIRVNIDDINDNPPVFQQNHFSVFFKEEQPQNEWHYQLIPYASDSDIGENAQLSYRITNYQNLFTISNNTLSNDIKISPTMKLDRETKASYLIIIEAIDGGKPHQLTGRLNLTVNIVDINDSQPTFTAKSLGLISVFVSEYANIGYRIAEITAYDDDYGPNSKLRFFINEKLSDVYGIDRIVINSSTGVLSLLKTLDREITDSISLNIVVADSGSPPRSSSLTLTVVINDENDNRPIIECQESFEITENRPRVTTVGLVKVYDLDSGANSNSTCTLKSIKSQYLPFQMAKVVLERSDYIRKSLVNTYEISTIMSLDREEVSSYSIMIFCFDHGLPPLTNSKEIIIIIGDQNDNKPTFNLSKINLNLLENRVPLNPIYKLNAFDIDSGINAELFYYIIDNIDDTFMINKSTGELFQIESVDYEQRKSFVITLGCRDRGLSSLTTSIKIFVTVIDVNDVPPTIDPDSMNPYIAEHMPVGTFVKNLSVIDPDTESGGNVFMYLLPWEKKFIIQDFQLFTNYEFDRELNDKYSILLILRDNGQPRLTSSILLTVTITDINDNDPKFNRIVGSSGVKVQNFTISFSYREPKNFPILTLYFHDDDIDDNARLMYSIYECNKPLFHIHPSSGHLKLNSSCESSDIGRLRLVIKVEDQGKSKRNSFLQLTMEMVDEPATSQEHIVITNFRIILIIIPTLVALSFSVILMFVIRTVQKQNNRRKLINSSKKSSKDIEMDKMNSMNDESLTELFPTTSYYSVYPNENCMAFASFLPCMDNQNLLVQSQNYVLAIDPTSLPNCHKLNIQDASTDSGNGDSSDVNINDCPVCSIGNPVLNNLRFSDNLGLSH